ncbi:MAG TPA: cation:proton antiporter [Bacteroidales bacterium]
MDLQNPYIEVIGVCLVLILSYQFNWLSKVMNIPSVLLLILLGIGIRFGLDYLGVGTGGSLMQLLQVIGIVGLIMIVLEASLELELTSEKRPLIIKSFFLALFSLAACMAFITYIINFFLIDDLFTAVLYSIPLSVVSSAIVIPSVGSLIKKNREFLIYESTFSDILAIMVFFYILSSVDVSSAGDIAINISINLAVTIVLSIIIGYLMVIILDKLQSQVKLFLLIAVLMLLYSIGKLFHFSSLIMILVFGIILNNNDIFFAGKIKRWIDKPSLKKVQSDFHLLTMESAFFIRTFFFVIFGITLELNNLLNLNAALISLAIIGGIYLIRAVILKMFLVKRLFPEVFVAPRGLITILLFFSIPASYQNLNFDPGILLYVILISSIVMALALMVKGKDREFSEKLNFTDWDELDREIEGLAKHKE